MNQANLTVVYASDDRGVVPLGVAIYSLLSTAAADTTYTVYVLANHISPANQARVGQLVTGAFARHAVVFLDVAERLATFNLPATDKWPIAAWSRVFIPNFLAGETGVVLYCDIDTLVCQDLRELFETPLHGKAAGVVLEHLSHEGSHFNARLDIPLACPGYFNSGVMLIDLDAFRQRKLVERILAYAVSHRDRLTCPDQDALNGALCDEVQPIHHKWNWHDGLTRLILKRGAGARMIRGATLEDAVEAALRPGILHYQGPNKPWRYNYRIERRRYRDALVESGFGTPHLPGWSLEKWLKSVFYTPIYALTWWKIGRLDEKFRRVRSGAAGLAPN